MNHLKQGLRILAITTALILPWNTAQALESFTVFGVITDTGPGRFTVRGQVYRIHPAVRFTSSNLQKASQLRQGDIIFLSGKILINTHLVDYIRHDFDDEED